MRLDTDIKPQEGAPAVKNTAMLEKEWADLMATNGHFYWPSVGSYVAAYGQFAMAANTAPALTSPIHWKLVTLETGKS